MTEAVCVGGVVTAPTLTPSTGPTGVAYSFVPAIDPEVPYRQGQSVTVTATLVGADLGWPAQSAMPAGWTITSATTATYTVTFKAVACTPVVPVDPDVVQATCANGVATVPSVTPAPTDGDRLCRRAG